MRAGLELGVWFAAGYITQSAGLLTTDASRASFLSTFTVLVVPLLAGISGRGVSLVTWAACFAALLGVGLLEQNGAPPGVGDIWSFLSAVAFGVQVFRTEHWARILGNGANLSLMSIGEGQQLLLARVVGTL
jgi:drug/metabolite transporter (DMT)-like permease